MIMRRAKWGTRLDLVSYALSRLPPRQLPLLGLYAYFIVQLCDRGWIDRSATGKAGTALVGVLTMVTGLLLSYRFSNAVHKWDEGKKVWSEVRTTIRDGVRMISIAQASSDDKDSTRVDELTGVLVGFAFALQHHLHNTRPLPQPPLSDLLPVAYLASLKRTEARVRFAETHASPRPTRLQRRSTGPPTQDEAGDWDLSSIAFSAEEALAKFSGDHLDNPELRQQLAQLNLPAESSPKQPFKSNLTAPHPPNLPLALLKLAEAYITGQVEQGWSEAQRERGLGLVKSLSAALGEAERLGNNPPPLPLTLHLSHLLLIYLAALPASLLCVVTGPCLVVITLIAGWCLLGLEALIIEVGGVFGPSENHHPLPLFANHILLESLDISPSFLRAYRARLVARGEDVAEIDKRCKRSAEQWSP